MRVVISGASGLVGRALLGRLRERQHDVARLARGPGPRAADEIAWDPVAGTIDAARLEGCEAVVHLAGENIAAGRWNCRRKGLIRDSRVRGTRLLAEALSRLQARPRALVCASAIGYYGDRGDELLDESAAPGVGFLADVCREWESAAESAAERGVRVVRLRFGVILSGQGGALAKMLLPFRLGLGGKVGSGRQYLSWIALDDAVGAICHALEAGELRGAVNAVSPDPVTNYEFTKTLGRVLRRPTIFPIPALVARLALGEMADELLLASARVQPRKLLESGYRFAYPTLESALRHVLGKR